LSSPSLQTKEVRPAAISSRHARDNDEGAERRGIQQSDGQNPVGEKRHLTEVKLKTTQVKWCATYAEKGNKHAKKVASRCLQT
jgi:hypothetical protein